MKPTDYKGKTVPFYEKTDSEDFKFGEGIYHVCATGSYYCYYDGESLVDRWKVMHGEQPYWQSDDEPTAFCYTPFEDWAKPIKIADEYVDVFVQAILENEEIDLDESKNKKTTRKCCGSKLCKTRGCGNGPDGCGSH